jgi:hypothetical protein
VKLFWEPAAMLALTKVSNMFPGGAITSAAAIVAWEASSATNIRGLTDWLVGSERGTKDPTLDHGGNPIPEGPNLDDILPDLPDPLGGGNSGKRERGPCRQRGPESVAVSLLDDIMVPLLKAVPGPLKAAGLRHSVAMPRGTGSTAPHPSVVPSHPSRSPSLGLCFVGSDIRTAFSVG